MALTFPQYLTQLERDAEAFAATIEAGDLEAPVLACPGWTVRDLGWHLGGVHRWASFALRENRSGEQTHAGPHGAAELAAWLRDGAGDLLALLRATEPTSPCWNFGPPPRVAGFWFRRQALETAVHLWDARRAVGAGLAIDPLPIDPLLAADGVDEVVQILFPRQVRLGRCEPLATALALVATDVTDDAGVGRWVLAGDADVAPDAREHAQVRGPAEALLLLVWRRATLEDPRLTVDGDARAARAVLAAPITP